MVELDPDAIAAALWNHYRETLSATVSAKAHYFSMTTRRETTQAALRRALAEWQKLDTRRRALAHRLGVLSNQATPETRSL